VVSRGAKIVLSVLDEAKAELERNHPGWRVWYVPRATGDVRWCAQRHPLLNDDSPDHLAESMDEVDEGRWPDGKTGTFPLPVRPEPPGAGA
jgi:hypothetical protein